MLMNNDGEFENGDEVTDYCEFFRRIEENPKVMIEMTVRELVRAKEHIRGCDTCYLRTERVLASAPPATPDSLWGEN